MVQRGWPHAFPLRPVWRLGEGGCCDFAQHDNDSACSCNCRDGQSNSRRTHSRNVIDAGQFDIGAPQGAIEQAERREAWKPGSALDATGLM